MVNFRSNYVKNPHFEPNKPITIKNCFRRSGVRTLNFYVTKVLFQENTII